MASVVCDAQDFGEGRAIDLSRLNEAERTVLRLLAQGHTAKSIANLIGTTPAAVNERLREARRKTGVGSSRELARLLRAQENRHEQMGVGRSRAPGEVPSGSDAVPWRPQTGVFAMIALFLIAAAGAAALMTQQPATDSKIDPLIGKPLERFAQPADLHAKVRAEHRDPAWAPRIEEEIRARLTSIPLVAKDGNALRVTCATTLCEIAGTLIAPADKAHAGPDSQFSQTITDLQTGALPDDLAHLGLKNESESIFSGEGKPDRVVFLL